MTYQALLKKTGLYLLIIAFMLPLFTACNKESDEPKLEDLITTDENGYLDVYTNNYGYCGYSIFIETKTEETPVLTSRLSDYIETNFNKISGFSGSYHGLYFNALDVRNYIAVLINTTGNYIIVKSKDSSIQYYTGTAWTSSQTILSSPFLNKGYNQVNTIKVAVTGENTYALFLNGTLTYTFTETTLLTGLLKGYLFTIDSKENEGLPEKFIQIKFKEIHAS